MRSHQERYPMAFVASLLSVVTTAYSDDCNIPAENEEEGGIGDHESSIALSQAWSIIQNRLKILEAFTLVVDGLDECDANDTDFALMMNGKTPGPSCPLKSTNRSTDGHHWPHFVPISRARCPRYQNSTSSSSTCSSSMLGGPRRTTGHRKESSNSHRICGAHTR